MTAIESEGSWEVNDANQKTEFGKLRNAGCCTKRLPTRTSFPTPDLNKITFSATIVLTTAHGRLEGRRAALFEVVTGLVLICRIIDPGRRGAVRECTQDDHR